MDLKSRLLEANLPAETVDRILESLSAAETVELASLNFDEFHLKIRDLLKRIEVLSIPKEVDVTMAGLKKPGQGNPSDTVKSLRPPPSLTDPNKAVSPLTAPTGEKLEKKRNFVRFPVYILIIAAAFYYFTKGSEKKETIDSVVNTTKPTEPVSKPTEPVSKPTELLENNIEPTVIQPKIIMPEIPSARGSWMFMPWDSYISETFCNDGRLNNLGTEYTVEFWFSKRIDIPGEVNLFEFMNEGGPVERIFLNDKNELCFTAANGLPVATYHKQIPSLNRHYHIAMTRNEQSYTLFINGNKRIEIDVKGEISSRSALRIMRSQLPLKGLAIDELRISNLAVYKEKFIPQRILEAGDTTLVYIPFEKDTVFHCYGAKKYSTHEFAGGKWLNVQYEVQQIINSLEFSED